MRAKDSRRDFQIYCDFRLHPNATLFSFVFVGFLRILLMWFLNSVYEDDDFPVPDGSSVIIKRVPARRSAPSDL